MTCSRTIALAVLVGAAGIAAGCRRTAAAKVEPAASASAPVPLDRLAPGELVPGSESLFGLVLPRGMAVGARVPGVAHVVGLLPAEDVANYIRDRVDAKRVELGAVGTVFPAVHIKGGDPSKVYRIEVNSTGPGTELVFHDVTPEPPPPLEPGLSQEEIWRRAGLTTHGKPIDPQNQR